MSCGCYWILRRKCNCISFASRNIILSAHFSNSNKSNFPFLLQFHFDEAGQFSLHNFPQTLSEFFPHFWYLPNIKVNDSYNFSCRCRISCFHILPILSELTSLISSRYHFRIFRIWLLRGYGVKDFLLGVLRVNDLTPLCLIFHYRFNCHQ